MASYTDRFGQGMMPMFSITPGATTPLDVGADAAATEAAYRDAIAERNATNESNIAAFNTGIESLRDLMSDEDQEEELLQDMITSAVVPELNANVLSDEDTGKFESGQTFTEDLTQSAADFLDLNPRGREIVGNVIEAPGEGIDFFVDEFESGYNPEQRNSALAVTGEAYRAAEPYIKDALKGTGNFFIDQYNKFKNTPIEKYEYETDFYQDLLGDKTREEEINSIPIYATGGRVDYNTGGLAYAYNPFMDMQQGFNYYNQFGSPVFPDIPTESPVEEVDPITTTPAIPGDVKPLGPQRGPEDRGSYADRFPSAEDQGYGYSGIPGEGGAATFNNPNFGSSVLGQGTGDTFTAAPGIGNAYDEYGRLRDIGVLNDLGLNLYGAAYPVAKAVTEAPIPGLLGLFASFLGFNKQKEEDDEMTQTTFDKTTKTMLDNYKKQQEIEAAAAKAKEDKLAEEAAIARAELEAIAKENKGKDEKAFQTGTGFTSDLAADTATGKFSNAKDKNQNNKGNFGGPSGHGSGKQGGKHGPAGGQRGKNTGTSRF